MLQHSSKSTSFTNNMHDNAKINNQTDNMAIYGGQTNNF
jgi:hypothetical protein